jgi:hypothetical protein
VAGLCLMYYSDIKLHCSDIVIVTKDRSYDRTRFLQESVLGSRAMFKTDLQLDHVS